MHVVAVHLPEARRVPVHELDAAHPFRTLPEVERRHHDPHWSAVHRIERLAIVGDREHRVIVGADVGHRHVRRVPAIAVEHHMRRRRTHLEHLKQIREQHPLPGVVIARPMGHTVDVVVLLRHPDVRELLIREDPLRSHLAPDLQVPVRRVDHRRPAVGQDGPLTHQPLAGRQPIVASLPTPMLQLRELCACQQLAHVSAPSSVQS